MALLSVDVRNAMLNALIATIGASPVIEIRTGTAPTRTTAADSGTLLAFFQLGASWAPAAADGSIHLSGAPLTATAPATGQAGHFRLKSSGGVTHFIGTVTETDDEDPGDMTLETLDIFSGRLVTITSWHINTPS